MAAAKQPNISDAEWEVMKVLWAGAPLTAGQVVERVAAEQRWQPRTIKTLLGRLVRKGAAEMRLEGKSHLYRAKATRESCVRRESKSFLARVFDGAVAPAMAHFIEAQKLSHEEIEQLRQLLDRGGQDR